MTTMTNYLSDCPAEAKRLGIAKSGAAASVGAAVTATVPAGVTAGRASERVKPRNADIVRATRRFRRRSARSIAASLDAASAASSHSPRAPDLRVLVLFEPRRSQAKPARRPHPVRKPPSPTEMAARLPPKLRRQRRFRHRDMALRRVRVCVASFSNQ